MNSRLQKVIEEIEKTRKKLSELQTRLKELERQKIEIENTDIVAMVRGLDIAPEDLRDFIELLQKQSTMSQNIDTTRKEEKEHEE